MSDFSDIVIGIDLGTTNSCVAYYFNSQVKILENSEGKRLTPSVVAYIKNNAIIVGEFAKKIALYTPESCVHQIKRLIGRKTNDLYVQSILKYFPFTLDKKSDEPIVLIKQKTETIRKTPVEICATILKKIKYDVENKLGVEIQKAVITVPAYFNVTQREATLEAANAAGFTVLKLMNEPTAAALSYYHGSHTQNEKYSLVFDFGGGTLDVAILKRLENDIEIVGVDGDSHLGGQDIDNLIVDFVCNKLEKDYKFNCRENVRLMSRLQNICEEAKKELSSLDKTNIPIDAFTKDELTDIELTRSQLEDVAAKLFERSLHVISNCLVNCNLKKSDIGDVILSGGTTRIPKLQQMLSEFFGNKKLTKWLNVDECVAEGAALQAAMFSTNPSQKINHIKTTDVVALSLGTDLLADVMNFIIKRNTPLPVTKSSRRLTVNNQQSLMRFRIYEGERLNAQKNRFLHELIIDNLTPAPPGECEVILTMSIDTNGILKVKAQEKIKNNTKHLQLKYTRGTRNYRECRSVMKDAEDNKEEDKQFMRFAVYKTYLLKYCNAIVYNFEKTGLDVTKRNLYFFYKGIAIEVDSMQMEEEEKIKKLIKEMEQACKSLIEKYGFKRLPSLENEAKKLNITQFVETKFQDGEIVFKEPPSVLVGSVLP